MLLKIDPWALFAIPRFAMHFMADAVPPTGDPPAPGQGGPGTGTPPAPATDADVVPRAEAQKAFKSRDEAKTLARLLASQFGLDPAAIKVVPNTGDDAAANPYKLEGDGLEEAVQLLTAARTEHQERRRSRQTAAEREKELTGNFQREIQTRAAAAQAERESLENLIREQHTVPALRAAFAAEGAFDYDNSGNYEDLIALTKNRVKVDITSDAETGKRSVEVIPLKEDGSPMLDSKGNKMSVRQLAADFLAKRPNFRTGKFQPGPGAGGRGAGAYQAGGRQTDPKSRGEATADKVFGKQKA